MRVRLLSSIILIVSSFLVLIIQPVLQWEMHIPRYSCPSLALLYAPTLHGASVVLKHNILCSAFVPNPVQIVIFRPGGNSDVSLPYSEICNARIMLACCRIGSPADGRVPATMFAHGAYVSQAFGCSSKHTDRGPMKMLLQGLLLAAQ